MFFTIASAITQLVFTVTMKGDTTQTCGIRLQNDSISIFISEQGNLNDIKVREIQIRS